MHFCAGLLRDVSKSLTNLDRLILAAVPDFVASDGVPIQEEVEV